MTQSKLYFYRSSGENWQHIDFLLQFEIDFCQSKKKSFLPYTFSSFCLVQHEHAEGCLQYLGVWDPVISVPRTSQRSLSLCQAGQQLWCWALFTPKGRNDHFLLSHPQRIYVFSSFELNLPRFFAPLAFSQSERAVGRGSSSTGTRDAVLAGYRGCVRAFPSSSPATWRRRQAVFQSFCLLPVTTLWSIPISIDLLA